MQVRTSHKLALNGTKKHLQQYGDQRVCVTYRYGKSKNKRQTILELILDEQA
jgi:hypothetical protein